MRKTKYRLENFAFWDYKGIEKHLTQMAEKGWQLSQIISNVWIYKKAEPESITYSVTYIPKVSAYDPEKTEAATQMDEYCESVGWKKVTSYAQMQIYRTDAPNIRPLETDELVRLQVIGRTMKKTALIPNLLYLLLYILIGSGYYKMYQTNPIDLLSQNTLFYSLLFIIIGLFSFVYSIVYLTVWLRQSRKSIDTGGQCLPVRYYRLPMHICTMLLIILLVAMLFSSEETFRIISSIRLLCRLAFFCGITLLLEIMRRKGTDKATTISVFLFITVIYAIIETFTFQSALETQQAKESQPEHTYYEKGVYWNIYNDYLPIRAEDLTTTEHQLYSTQYKEQESFLLSYIKCNQSPVPYGTDAPYLWYEILDVKIDFIYNKCVEHCLNQDIYLANWINDNIPGTKYNITNKYHKLSQSDWKDDDTTELYANADAIYRRYHEEEPVCEWLICKDNYIFHIQSNWQLSGTQMNNFILRSISYEEEASHKNSVLSNNNTFLQAYPDTEPDSLSYILSDGTQVNCFGYPENDQLSFCLKDGTKLLVLWDKVFFYKKMLNPANTLNTEDNSKIENSSNLEDSRKNKSTFWELNTAQNLTPQAEETIYSYLESLPINYDLKEELENAYSDYLTQKDKTFSKQFEAYYLERFITLHLDAKNYLVIEHSLYIPNDITSNKSFDSPSEYLYFDKETGRKMDISEFFLLSEEELSTFFATIWTASETTSENKSTIKNAFSSDYLSLHITNEELYIDLLFPAGTLESYAVMQSYPAETLKDILQPWVFSK